LPDSRSEHSVVIRNTNMLNSYILPFTAVAATCSSLLMY